MEIDAILRFHLAFEDAAYLLENGKNILNMKSAQILFDFLEKIQHLKVRYPKCKFAERRNYVLIGQNIMGQFSMVQTGKILVAVKGKEYINIDSDVESALTLIGENSVFSNFNPSEFENLEEKNQEKRKKYLRIWAKIWDEKMNF